MKPQPYLVTPSEGVENANPSSAAQKADGNGVPPYQIKRKSWVSDVLILLLFAVTVGALLLSFGTDKAADEAASSDDERNIKSISDQSLEDAKTDELPPLRMKGAGRVALPDPFIPESARQLKREEESQPIIDAYTAESASFFGGSTEDEAAGNPTKKSTGKNKLPLSLEEQQEILKIMNGEQ